MHFPCHSATTPKFRRVARPTLRGTNSVCERVGSNSARTRVRTTPPSHGVDLPVTARANAVTVTVTIPVTFVTEVTQNMKAATSLCLLLVALVKLFSVAGIYNDNISAFNNSVLSSVLSTFPNCNSPNVESRSTNITHCRSDMRFPCFRKKKNTWGTSVRRVMKI